MKNQIYNMNECVNWDHPKLKITQINQTNAQKNKTKNGIQDVI